MGLNELYSQRFVGEGLTFDDVLLIPSKSEVLPRDINLSTRLTNRIRLNIPRLSAAMVTVTEADLAIAIAREGGAGVIHKNMPIETQVDNVLRVKRSENGVIVNPFFLSPDNYASEAEELADLTADNRIAELATTDNKMLAEVFADIDTGEIPFMLSGYTEDDYGNIVTALSEALHTKEPSSDPDAEIPAPAAPVTQYGDLWILGRHRVLCGDCTRPEDRALLLDGNKPEILLTDPPYCSGGSKESQKSTGSIGTERKNGKAPKIANDILSTRGYQNLIRGALTDIPCLYAYIFTDWRMWVYLFDLVEAAGFGVKSEIVWDKGTPGMGVGWRSQHELILFGA